MFRKMIVPVDLAHLDTLKPALTVASDLATHYGTEVCYVSVTHSAPGTVAHSPEEYERKLAEFASQEATKHGQATTSRVVVSGDPVAELDDELVKAIKNEGADLVVMATHHPRALDIIMPANGSKVAKETDASIFLVRP